MIFINLKRRIFDAAPGSTDLLMKRYIITKDGLNTTVQYQEGPGEDLFPVDLSFTFTPQDDAAASVLADSAGTLIEKLVNRRLIKSDKEN